MVKRKVFLRPKAGNCYFCKGGEDTDWKKVEILSKFISERGKILSRARTGICAKHQRRFAKAVKRARYLSLLPFVTKVE